MRSARIPRVRQHDVTDCGAACLASIAKHHGVRVPLARIRQLAGTDRGGTSLTGLINAAEQLGFAARGIRAPAEVLDAVPLPAVAHLSIQPGWTHFVVLCAADSRSVRIMDPADGHLRRLGREEFCEKWSGILLLIVPAEANVVEVGRATSALERFWRLAAPHRGVMLQAAIGAVAYTILGLSMAVFVQKLVDHVIPGGNRELLDLLGLAMLTIVAAQMYLRCTRDLLVLRTGQKLDARLIHGYYDHLMRLPQRFFDTMRVGEIVSRLNDAVKIRHFLNEVSLDLAVNLLVIVFSFALMLVYSRQLAALVAASIPLYLALFWVANRSNRKNQRRTMEAAADLEAHVVETVTAASTIRSLQLQDHVALGAELRVVRLLRPVYSAGRMSLLSGGAGEFISRCATVALLWFGAVLVLRQQLTAGELMSFYALNGHLTPPVLALLAANRQVQDALIAADRLYDVLDLEQERDDGVIPFVGKGFGAIRLRDVHFRYGSRPPVFRGLELVIREGEITALVGESGSGKSTIAALLQRAHLPQVGRILYGDVDVRYFHRESLLRRVAVVPQEIVLFTGTLLDNLVPGGGEPDLERLGEILSQLRLRELEETLPYGYRTPLGERGSSLSGGQRQRIALARALYGRPDVLILDEATSGLDVETESAVQAILRRLQAGGTTILTITHRLASAVRADRILVLGEGRLLEEGTHAELLQGGGVYYRLWREQTSAWGTSRRDETGRRKAVDGARPRFPR